MNSALGKRRRTRNSSNSSKSSNHTLRNVVRNMNSKLANFKTDVYSIEHKFGHLNSNLNLSNFQNFDESNANFTSRKQTGKQTKLFQFFLKKMIDPNVHNKGEILQKLIHEHGFDPSFNDDAVLKFASQKGIVDVVKVLLSDERMDLTANGNNALMLAITKNHENVGNVLLNDPLHRVVPTNDTLYLAIKHNSLTIVHVLLADPRVDPTADYNRAIKLAIENGFIDVMERLLQDPRIIAIPYIIQLLQSLFKVAIGKGHMAIVKRLIQDPRIVLVEGEFTIMPLLIACKNARVEMVDYLLKQLLKPEYANKFTKKKIDYIINKINNNIIHNIIPKEINSTYTPQNFPNIVTLLQEFNTQVFGKRRRTQKKR